MSKDAEVAVAVGDESSGGEELDDSLNVPVVGRIVERELRESFEAINNKLGIGGGIFGGGIEKDGVVMREFGATIGKVGAAVGVLGRIRVSKSVNVGFVFRKATAVFINTVPVGVVRTRMKESSVTTVASASEERAVDGFDSEIEALKLAVDIEFSEGGKRSFGASGGGEFKGEIATEIARFKVETTKDELIKAIVAGVVVFLEVERVVKTIGVWVISNCFYRAVAANREGDVGKSFAIDSDACAIFGFFARSGEEVGVILASNLDVDAVNVRVVENFVRVVVGVVEAAFVGTRAGAL